MKKGMGIIAGALALAGLGASAQVAQSLAAKSANEIQATNTIKQRREKLPFVNGGTGLKEFFGKPFGLTPKEYGQLFGTGASRKHRSNMNRYAHNAKVSRRRSC